MNIKEMKVQINILTNINKITNTMSMISFSKMGTILKKCKILNNLYKETKKIILENYDVKNNKINCCILITTNKGFCGSINNESIKFFLRFLKNNKNLDLIIIGKKAIDFFDKKNIYIKKKIIFNEKSDIFFSKDIIELLKKYKNIFFISSKIINNSIKSIKTELFVKKKKCFYEKKYLNNNFLFEKYINYSLKHLFYENYYCELKSRMITMKSAADSSKKIIKNMNIIKNKIRQFKVTQEMLEIINGSHL
ncbi:F0F1 ATP synthase subunit gamma [Candidatus Carsonella ruddii]|uniref:F0F1 ATP synthase subunit gamma n=1 Tax=Carsonella ruddii TaxID=114186 RepID=UPI003D813B52